MDTVWHYTVGPKLPLIFGSAVLRPFGAGAKNELPVVWFSSLQSWEPTATKAIGMNGGSPSRPSKEVLHALCRLYRFGISPNSPEIMPWPVLWRKAGLNQRSIKQLLAFGAAVGSGCSHWYGALNDVAVSSLIFEAWDGTAWQTADLHERATAEGMAAKHIRQGTFDPHKSSPAFLPYRKDIR